MKNYNYKLLLDDLKLGREIEFQYNNNLYGIVHFVEGWFIVCDNKGISEYYEDPVEMVSIVRINEKTLQELFDSGEIVDERFSVF